MADFLTDYSNLAGAGSAFQGFAQGFQNAQDNKMKRQEMQAKMDAMKADQDRAATESALKVKLSGLQQGPGGPTDLQPGQVTPKIRMDEDLKGAGEGFNINRDGQGNYTGLSVNKESPKYRSSIVQGLRGQAAMENVDTRRDNQSAQAVAKIHQDKALSGMRQQATMIDKGLELTSDPNNPPSVVAMHEFAQDVSAALAGKAASSDMKLRSISTPSVREKLANLESYITSNPNQPAPPEVVKFWNGMGNRLKEAYGRQMAARAGEVAKQAGTVYKHNPAAQKAQQDAAQMYKDGSWRDSSDIQETASPQQQAPQQQAAPPPQGLVQPQQGFLGKAAGMLGFGQPAQAAPAQTATPDVIKYAKDHNITVQQAQTIKTNRTGGQ